MPRPSPPATQRPYACPTHALQPTTHPHGIPPRCGARSHVQQHVNCTCTACVLQLYYSCTAAVPTTHPHGIPSRCGAAPSSCPCTAAHTTARHAAVSMHQGLRGAQRHPAACHVHPPAPPSSPAPGAPQPSTPPAPPALTHQVQPKASPAQQLDPHSHACRRTKPAMHAPSHPTPHRKKERTLSPTQNTHPAQPSSPVREDGRVANHHRQAAAALIMHLHDDVVPPPLAVPAHRPAGMVRV